jgi:hypothetical protein
MKKAKLFFGASAMFFLFMAGCDYNYNEENGIVADQTDIATVQNYVTWNSGNAASECLQAGACEGGYSWKIDAAAPNGEYNTNTDMYDNTPTEVNAVITISNSDGKSFDWSISDGFAVCAVIVKAGQGAAVYSYTDATSDNGLLSPKNSSGNIADISHVTFCFKELDNLCYKQETAWAAGQKYVPKGNWATFTNYLGNEMTVNIYAAQTMLAGTVHFSAVVNGSVTIKVNLSNDFVFYYDLIAKENLKVEGYSSVPPKTNPAPGLFTYKYVIPVGSTSKEITVPYYPYYGIHLDVAYGVQCQQ